MNRSPDQAHDPERLVDAPPARSVRAALGRLLHGASILAALGLGVGLTFAWVIFLCWAAYGLLWLVIG
jgi:hypothetical protein